MSSKNILQQALQQYEGTCMIVSHDRAFLDPIVNKVLEIRPGQIHTYLGNVSYYLDKKKEELEHVSVSNNAIDKSHQDRSKVILPQNNGNDRIDGISRKEQRRLEAERRNELNKKTRPLKKKLGQVEKEIENNELRKVEIEELMVNTDFYEDNEQVKKVTLEYENIKKTLTNLMYKWEEYSMRIEAVEEEL
jgi:ATP-binding cassette subfamily F protein 3